MWTIIAVLLGSLFLLFIGGWWGTIWMVPERYQSYRLMLAPFLGIGYFEIFAQNLSVWNIPTLVSRWIILGFLILAYLIIFLLSYRKKKDSCMQEEIIPKEEKNYHIFAWVPGLFSAMIFAGPLLQLGYLTWYGGNTDATAYIRYAHFLQKWPVQQALHATDIAYPWIGWVHVYLCHDFLGSAFLISVFSSIFTLDPFQMYNIIMACYGFLIPGSVYLILSMCFGLSRRFSFFCAFLMACQNFWITAGYFSCLNQISGLPYYILLFGLLYLCLQQTDWKLYLLTGIILSILISHYSVVLVIIFLPIFLWLILRVRRMTIMQIKSLGRGILLIMAVPFILHQLFSFRYSAQVNCAIPSILKPILQKSEVIEAPGMLSQYMMRGLKAGNIRSDVPEESPFLTSETARENLPQYWMSFFNLLRSYTHWASKSNLEKEIYIFVAFLLLGVSLFSVIIVPPSIRLYYRILYAVFILFFLFAYYADYFYGLWKTLAFIQFLAMIGIGLSLEYIFNSLKEYSKLKTVFGMLVIYFSIHNVVRAIEVTHRPFYYCDESIIQLSEAKKIVSQYLGKDGALEIGIPDVSGVDAAEWLSVIYMFKDIPVLIPENSPRRSWFFFTQDYPASTLKPKLKLASYINNLDLASVKNVIWSNKKYYITAR